LSENRAGFILRADSYRSSFFKSDAIFSPLFFRWAAANSSAHFSAKVSYDPVGRVGPWAFSGGDRNIEQPDDKDAIKSAPAQTFVLA
jgi:hypothetical protein